jgi:scyllo-inositol 2-dehydrogenase (NADP+)
MADQMGVGLIGYGMAGRTFHAPVIQSVLNFKLKKKEVWQDLDTND